MAGIPGPVIGGTFLFIFIGLIFAAFGGYMRKVKRLDKDSSQIYCVTVAVTGVCFWIMWLCTWLHQWHPIIYPLVTHQPGVVEHPATGGGAGSGAGGGH